MNFWSPGDSTGYTELGDKQPMQFWVQIGETRQRRQAGPAVSERKKRKEKEKEKEKGAGARFRFFIKPDKRDPRSATLAHVSRDQTKPEDYLNSAPKRRSDPSARSEADSWPPLSESPSPPICPCAEEKEEEGRKRGRERNLLSSIPLGSSKNGRSRRQWNDQFEI